MNEDDLWEVLRYFEDRSMVLRESFHHTHAYAICTGNGMMDVCQEIRKVLEGKESYAKGWEGDLR